MRKTRLLLALLILPGLGPLVARSAVEEEAVSCEKSLLLKAPADSGKGRRFAPDREIDVIHLTLDVTPDYKARTISGTTTLRFRPIAKPLRKLRLDAVDLRIGSVESSVAVSGWQSDDEALIITFAEPIPAGTDTRVTISHSAEPKEGLYFRTPEMGYKEGDTHIWTQGEPDEARHWFPNHDYPNEKFTSEITCHVPPDMTVLSNGRMISESVDAATGLKAVRWLMDKPHPNYLIALCAGYFEKIEDRYKDVPLRFFTPRSQIENAKNSFRETADIMGFFEREIGIPFPWPKYDQVVVDDFTAGGMENTSITILTDRTLFTDATENIRSSQNLNAHEMAHQWFGDYVTCKDWSHIWLNEGFATYYALLYDEYKNGRDSMLYGLWKDAKRIIAAKEDTLPITDRTYTSIMSQFGLRGYQKGSWVLHMLRNRLGEDLYRKCIKTYLERHAVGNVVTHDLSEVIEELSGRSWDGFFDQWVEHGGFPELSVSYDWNEEEKLAKISVRQTQAINEKVLLFRFPVTIRFKTKGGTFDREARIEEKEQDFYFPLDSQPKSVRFDPSFSILADIKFDPPRAMLEAQLEDQTDGIGRILAIDALKSKKEATVVEKLKKVLNNDPFYGARIEAAKALREIHTNEAFDALAASTEQPDARARRAVQQELGGFYREEAMRAGLKTIEKEKKNPDVISAALGVLGKYSDEAARGTISRYLESDSYRNSLADAAIQAIRAVDQPEYIAPLRKVLAEKEKSFTSFGFGAGLDALAYLARNQEDKKEVREFLAGYVNHKKRVVRLMAVTALGTLKDPAATALVETFTGNDEGDPVQGAAKRALASIREVRKIPVELDDLRTDVLDLKKDNEKLKKDFDDLKTKMKAKEAAKLSDAEKQDLRKLIVGTE